MAVLWLSTQRQRLSVQVRSCPFVQPRCLHWYLWHVAQILHRQSFKVRCDISSKKKRNKEARNIYTLVLDLSHTHSPLYNIYTGFLSTLVNNIYCSLHSFSPSMHWNIFLHDMNFTIFMNDSLFYIDKQSCYGHRGLRFIKRKPLGSDVIFQWLKGTEK